MEGFDDLAAKLNSRNLGHKSNKSMMSLDRFYWQKNPELTKSSSTLTTDFDSIYINENFNLSQPSNFDHDIKQLRYKMHDIPMKTNFLFTDAEAILEELAISKNKRKNKCQYGQNLTIYSLPVTGQINMVQDSQVQNDQMFLFKSKYYDLKMIYKINLSTSDKLDTICSSNLLEPDNLPYPVKQLESSASNGKSYFNINRAINFKYNSRTNSHVEFENESEILNSNNFTCFNLIKKTCEPIYVKINSKSKYKITHLGFLGCAVPVITYCKKQHSLGQKTNRKMSAKLYKSFHILDTAAPLSYVKKLEIWFRGSKTKKWYFLKTINLGFSGLIACYQEELVPIYNNFNDLEGLETSELKIIPLEYVNSPTIRIGVYGFLINETNPNSKKGFDENCEIVNYIIKDSTKSDKILKYGKNWNSTPYEYMKNFKNKKKRQFENQILNEI